MEHHAGNGAPFSKYLHIFIRFACVLLLSLGLVDRGFFMFWAGPLNHPRVAALLRYWFGLRLTG